MVTAARPLDLHNRSFPFRADVLQIVFYYVGKGFYSAYCINSILFYGKTVGNNLCAVPKKYVNCKKGTKNKASTKPNRFCGIKERQPTGVKPWFCKKCGEPKGLPWRRPFPTGVLFALQIPMLFCIHQYRVGARLRRNKFRLFWFFTKINQPLHCSSFIPQNSLHFVGTLLIAPVV